MYTRVSSRPELFSAYTGVVVGLLKRGCVFSLLRVTSVKDASRLVYFMLKQLAHFLQIHTRGFTVQIKHGLICATEISCIRNRRVNSPGFSKFSVRQFM